MTFDKKAIEEVTEIYNDPIVKNLERIVSKQEIQILKLKELCYDFAILNQAENKNDRLQDRLTKLMQE